MQYGFFDNAKREYVITDPRTPMPWANYLGSPEYGAIVTQNAGGYSFVKSGAAGRILRYMFNQFDEPGRYIYLRDQDSGDFWSASWRPVEKDLKEYDTITRHGTSYTEIESEYNGIASKALYYVPLDATHEVWRLSVTNTGDEPRKIAVFGYAEFTTESFYTQDLVNMQYTQFITVTEFHKDHILERVLPCESRRQQRQRALLRPGWRACGKLYRAAGTLPGRASVQLPPGRCGR